MMMSSESGSLTLPETLWNIRERKKTRMGEFQCSTNGTNFLKVEWKLLKRGFFTLVFKKIVKKAENPLR